MRSSKSSPEVIVTAGFADNAEDVARGATTTTTTRVTVEDDDDKSIFQLRVERRRVFVGAASGKCREFDGYAEFFSRTPLLTH